MRLSFGRPTTPPPANDSTPGRRTWVSASPGALGAWTESSRDLREGLLVIEHGCQRDWNDYVMPTPALAEDWSKLGRVN